jgi:hypothetical protein
VLRARTQPLLAARLPRRRARGARAHGRACARCAALRCAALRWLDRRLGCARDAGKKEGVAFCTEWGGRWGRTCANAVLLDTTAARQRAHAARASCPRRAAYRGARRSSGRARAQQLAPPAAASKHAWGIAACAPRAGAHGRGRKE